MYIYTGLGQGLGQGAAMVGTAIVNVGVQAHHAVKVGQLQRKFSSKLENDEEKKQYIKYIAQRINSVATRLGKNGRFRAGTPEYEEALTKVLSSDMTYRGNCNADIYYPMTTKDAIGKPRKVWASISRSGFVKPGTPVPRDIGPIWATGCKNAHDAGRMAYIQRFKGEKKHSFFKTHKEDLGSMNLLLRAATGIFMVIALVIVTRVQKAVIKEQAPPKRRKRRKKKPAAKRPADADTGA
jgi:hypothetical protein